MVPCYAEVSCKQRPGLVDPLAKLLGSTAAASIGSSCSGLTWLNVRVSGLGARQRD